jgi:hypothetical protein
MPDARGAARAWELACVTHRRTGPRARRQQPVRPASATAWQPAGRQTPMPPVPMTRNVGGMGVARIRITALLARLVPQ